MKTSLKNTLKIYFRDLKGMVKNPISILIISGLCLVPSLYSFLNVIGCWDAYSNTSKLQIAIVNEDKGTTMAGKKLNVGDSIVDQLKTNNTIDWRFVSPEEGKIGLASGEFFSELIIPPDFSANLSTITSSNPVKPNLIYNVNTKTGPVANKITEVAQQNLVAQIRSSIMSSISSQIFTTVDTYGDKAKKNKDEILALKSAIINLNNNMGVVQTALTKVTQNSSDLKSYLDSIKTMFPEINSGLGQIKSSTENVSNIASSTKGLMNTALNNISSNLNEASSSIDNINNLLSEVKTQTDSSKINSTLNNVSNGLDTVDTNIQSTIAFLNGIFKSSKNESVKNLINKLEATENAINSQKTAINNAIKESTSTGKNLTSSAFNNLQSNMENTSNLLNSSISDYNNNVKSDLNSISQNLISATSTAGNLIGETQNLNGKIQNILNSTSDGSNLASQTSNDLNNYLNQYKGIIKQLSDKLEAVSDKNVDEIISLLQGSPVVMSNYVASPFNFTREVIYPVANYGSGMTPVYSVLAFWVGCLLMSSILKTEPPEFEGLENISIRERHFGKMLTFITIAVVQSLIITIGAKFLLGVQVINLPLFILSSVVTAATFAIITFTIVSIFRTVGKAMCIILMVVQLSGTGGTYPVQAMPLFFRIVEPYLPFPYGVNIMREAIGGPYWPNVNKDIVSLIIFSIIFILIGYFFKKPTFGFFNMFEGKFHESGLAEED